MIRRLLAHLIGHHPAPALSRLDHLDGVRDPLGEHFATLPSRDERRVPLALEDTQRAQMRVTARLLECVDTYYVDGAIAAELGDVR